MDMLVNIATFVAIVFAAFFAGSFKTRRNVAKEERAKRDETRKEVGVIQEEVRTQDDMSLVDRISRKP